MIFDSKKECRKVTLTDAWNAQLDRGIIDVNVGTLLTEDEMDL